MTVELFPLRPSRGWLQNVSPTRAYPQTEVERRKMEDYDKQVMACEVRMMEQRKTMGGTPASCRAPPHLTIPSNLSRINLSCAGVNATKDTGAQNTKQQKILENRLEKAIVRFNESVGQNKALREEIDNLRRERVVFDQASPRRAPIPRRFPLFAPLCSAPCRPLSLFPPAPSLSFSARPHPTPPATALLRSIRRSRRSSRTRNARWRM